MLMYQILLLLEKVYSSIDVVFILSIGTEQAISHDQNQCWWCSLKPYGMIRPHKVNSPLSGWNFKLFCQELQDPISTISTGIGGVIVPSLSPWNVINPIHNNDVIMSAMVYQLTSLTIVYSTVYSRCRSKKTSKLQVTGLCQGNSLVKGEFPAQRAGNAENLSIWWRHHDSSVNFQVWFSSSQLER